MVKANELLEWIWYAYNNHFGYIWGTCWIEWTKAKQDKATRASTVKYGAKWIGHTVCDCANLIRGAGNKVGVKIHSGSNLIWDCDLKAKGQLANGQRSDGMQLQPCTAVFTGTKDDHPHVGMYVGDGLVIEAAGTEQGVIISKITDSKWKWWGELNCVEYEKAEPVPVPPEGDEKKMPTIRKGNKGKVVREMQEKLLQLGYNLGICGADADFGVATEKALKQFQREHGLVEDGICGPKTWAALNAAETPTTAPEPIRTYSVIIKGLDLTQAQALAAKYSGAELRED